VRVDSGVTAGSEVSGLYDPMIAKLIVHDLDRETARRRMLRALREFEIGGIKTLVGFHRALLDHPCFVEGTTCNGLVESELIAERAEQLSSEAATAGAPAALLSELATVAEVDGRRVSVKVLVPEPAYRALARARREREAAGAAAGASGLVASPMQGTVLEVKIAEGDLVAIGQVLCIVEAMKMENEITAHRAGTVTGIVVTAGMPVTTGQPICVIEPADP
jgi:acetyl-CoA/propionyl-CoA carboxylase biotin carboxyl carrier protein